MVDQPTPPPIVPSASPSVPRTAPIAIVSLVLAILSFLWSVLLRDSGYRLRLRGVVGKTEPILFSCTRPWTTVIIFNRSWLER
jgi:hypothetical protein